MSDVINALVEIQRELKCDKSQYNSFGKFPYRSKEDILEAVKPLATERGCAVLVDDAVEVLQNGWVYTVATATITHAESGETISVRGWAREPQAKKGMDESQITGTAASYAGKRALGNLFAIDDTKDADTPPQDQEAAKKAAYIHKIGTLRKEAEAAGVNPTGIVSYIETFVEGGDLDKLNLNDLTTIGKYISNLISDKKKSDGTQK